MASPSPPSRCTSISARLNMASATTPSRISPPTCASLAASAGTRASTSPSPTPRSTRPFSAAATTPEPAGIAQWTNRPRRRLQRHQARPPELSEIRRPRLPARRRQSELWPREHRRELLHTGTPGEACSMRVDVQHIDQPRLQPRPRSGLGRLGARARGLLNCVALAGHMLFQAGCATNSRMPPK